MSLSELSQQLQKHKNALAKGFVESAVLAPRYTRAQAEDENFIQQELYCLVDFIEKGICESSTAFTNLYVGEKAKMAYVAGATGPERNNLLKNMISKDQEAVLKILENNKEFSNSIKNFFEKLISIFEKPPEKELKVLFIGDCLHLDVMTFLIPDSLINGINIVPEIVAEKNLIRLLSDLSDIRDKEFDLIFYSPFSYEFHKPFMNLALQNRMSVDLRNDNDDFEELFSEVRKVTSLLAQQFTCPIFVHNTAALLRTTDNLKGNLKRKITNKRRKTIRQVIDSNISLLIDTINSFSGGQVHKLDERQLVEKSIQEEKRLSEFLYWSELQHPVKFGMEIAKKYLDICAVKAKLSTKKLIVCDLDNTLWDGVIGEGNVQHYHEKQKILKAIKRKGVVLAIASKNDPQNVKWDGGTLNENDFVYSSINWEPKVSAFKKIERDLNLKSKDFIFIDDRADERAMVTEQYPGVLALDATEDASWEKLSLLEMLLNAPSSGDRTKMYLERAERNQYLSQEEESGVDQAEMFKKLGLKIIVKEANENDLSRVEELINRTNQFNIKGSRVTSNQILEMYQSQDYHIFATSMSDNFGPMGMISILICKENNESIDIEIFVLSCRVFGYDVEKVILDKVKILAKKLNKPVTGSIIETMHNAPCRKVFSQNNFKNKNDQWKWNSFDDSTEIPEWFQYGEF